MCQRVSSLVHINIRINEEIESECIMHVKVTKYLHKVVPI